MDEILSQMIFGNSVQSYLMFLLNVGISYLVLTVIKGIAQFYLRKWALKTKSTLDDKLVGIFISKMVPVLLILAIYFSTKGLVINPNVSWVIDAFMIAILSMIFAFVLSYVLIFLADNTMGRRFKDKHGSMVIKWIHIGIKIIIWSFALILYFDNIGIKITSLLAGFGVGGIAIAFAAQSILVDLFCWFTIYFDRPFELGDFLVIGEQKGTVEHIGMKTTRLRAPNGEQIVLANSDLTNSRINNFKTLVERRVLFKLGVGYETTDEQLRLIPQIIKDIVLEVGESRFDRVHFCGFGSYSLDFEIVYYVQSSDYMTYMDVNQEVNLRIKSAFEKHGIAFAFPTQTLQVKNPS